MIREINNSHCREIGELSFEEIALDRQRADFVIKNKLRHSAGKKKLGVIWLILDPVAMSSVYLFVLTVVRSYPNFESLFIGVSMFRIFQSSFTSGINSVKDFSGGITCERIRSRVLITAMVRFRILESFLQSVGVAFLLYLFLDVSVIAVFSFVALSVLLGLVSEGVGLNLSGYVRKIPDLANIVRYSLLLLFFASPVLYPLSMAEGLHYELNLLNPFTYFVEYVRYFCSLESEIQNFSSLATGILVFLMFSLFLRGYGQIDKVRWEVSSWS